MTTAKPEKPTQEMLRAATAYSARCHASNEIPSGKGYYEAMTAVKPEEPTSSEYAQGYAEGFNDGCAPKEPPAKTLGDPVTMEQCPNYKNCEGQCFQCEYYNSTTHRLEYPEPITPQPGSLNAIGVLAKVYCSNYASPHNIITFSASGLRKMIKAAQPLPPTEPDDLTIAYMSGFADGKKAAQPVQPAAQEVAAWMTEDGRVATTATKAVMASSSQLNFNVPLYARLALSGA